MTFCKNIVRLEKGRVPSARFILSAFMLVVAATMPSSLRAEYPDRPIRLLYPWPSGSATDGVIRFFANSLSKRLNTNVVVDNRSGADAIIGTEIIAKSAPDGYSLLASSIGPVVFNPAVYKKLPYDAEKDFEPLGSYGRSYYAILATPSFSENDVRGLVALAKQQPGSVKVGVYGATDLFLTLFESTTNTDLIHVPYRGGAPAVAATIGGEVNLTFAPAAYTRQYSGRLKALAVASTKRLSSLPDLPTFIEQGLPGFELANWLGVHAPRGIPRHTRDLLRQEIEAVARSPEFTNKIKAVGMEAEYMSAEDLRAYVQADIARWKQIMRKKNIPLR